MKRGRWILLLTAALVALAVPQAASSALTTVYSSGEISEPIGPQIGPTLFRINSASTISVPDVGTVVDVNVRVRLDHTYDSDLWLWLSGSDDTRVHLAASDGGDGDNFGSGPGCQSTFTVFDDTATTPIASGAPPFAGGFKPDEPLSIFAGKPTNGDWTLNVWDVVGGDSGTLLCWQLEITYELPAPPEADLRVQGTGTRSVKIGKKITYTVTVTNGGPGAATGVTLVDELPRGTTFLSAKANQGSCTARASRVRCELGDLAAGARVRITIALKAPMRPGPVTNVSTVDATEDDPKAGNNRLRTSTSVRR